MTFKFALDLLQRGYVVTRECFDDLVIFMQIPAKIPSEKITNMQSVPDRMKKILIDNNLRISYKNQFIIYNLSNEEATYYYFNGDDLNADDWCIVSND